MADRLTPEQRSRAMKRVKLKNGSLEKLVQRELRTKGLRFRRHVRSLPGCPDIVFAHERVAIFVDGDFWHGWRFPKWEHKLSPFWREKLRANRARDVRNYCRLRRRGWRVIRLWQHQVKSDLTECIERVQRALNIWDESSCRRTSRELKSKRKVGDARRAILHPG
jgi:DNA mismatch endonuclease (patch repair protein)